MISKTVAFAERDAWRDVPDGWRPLYGDVEQFGVSVEWHDFRTEQPLDWGRSFHPRRVEFCLNLGGHGAVGQSNRLKQDYVPGTSGYYSIADEPLSATRQANEQHQFVTLEFSRKHLQRQLDHCEEDLDPQMRAAVFSDKESAVVSTPHPLTAGQRGVVGSLLQPPVPKAAQALWYQSKALELMAHFLFTPKDPELFCMRHKRVARERVKRAQELIARNLAEPVKEMGSGFVISADGRILTNNHVISGSSKIEVTLPDQSRYIAKVLVRDRGDDLALIQIEPKKKLPFLKLGDSDTLQVGQKVLAIGNPFGYAGTLTTGVVSSLGREIRSENSTLEGLVQIDAAINEGNSGGPLLDSQGTVIGINTAIFAPNGGNIGIGFAMPINRAKAMLEDFRAGKSFGRPRFGVSTVYIAGDVAEQLKLPASGGLLIQEVGRGTAAATAEIPIWP
jgi:S1-C subfamily serine protease